MRGISAEITKAIVVVVSNPLPVFAPKILQNVRTTLVKKTFLLGKVVSHVADENDSELA